MLPLPKILLLAGLLPSAVRSDVIRPINKCVVPVLLDYIRCGNLLPSYCLPGLEVEIIEFCESHSTAGSVTPIHLARHWDPMRDCPPVDQKWLSSWRDIASVCKCLAAPPRTGVPPAQIITVSDVITAAEGNAAVNADFDSQENVGHLRRSQRGPAHRYGKRTPRD
ncbi:hypothetical protein B0T16DRAFT_490864 [Cercophora newfieldiana]|uniref:Uncharacterized protein n=1 Tax=Cercophora newfieldiana TaxID=92897 RepID=A0AA39YIB7_9PEZI|nr:hypothetical protein B0T16DRAFT_490864 [Cercophora newfieldiana]